MRSPTAMVRGIIAVVFLLLPIYANVCTVDSSEAGNGGSGPKMNDVPWFLLLP